MGFISYRPNDFGFLIGYQPSLPNYVFKGYSDTCPDQGNHYTSLSLEERLLCRVETADRMLRVIDTYDLQHVLVPHKWVLPLPYQPRPPKRCPRQKPFIIVAEMLPIVGYAASCDLFFSPATYNPRWIVELYVLFNHVGFLGLHLNNMHFTSDGQQLAFYDLEHPTDDLSICQNLFRNSLPLPWREFWNFLDQHHSEVLSAPVTTSGADALWDAFEAHQASLESAQAHMVTGLKCAHEDIDPRVWNWVDAGWEDDPTISEAYANLFRRHLIPEDHPAKSALDEIFEADRVTLNLEAFLRAGFELTERQGAQVLVARHPLLPGYVVKAHLDTQARHDDLNRLGTRLEGARMVREIIESREMHSIKAPMMWAYPLPLGELVPQTGGYARKHFLIIAEDIAPVRYDDNLAMWKSDLVTYSMLDELYVILSAMRFYDVHPVNIPFCEDGRIAFCDFEDYFRKRPNFENLVQFLNKTRASYWKQRYKSYKP